MELYHYFEKEKGPFCNLSDLILEDAKKVLGEKVQFDMLKHKFGVIISSINVYPN